MNTYTLKLSSGSTNNVQQLPPIELNDITKLIIQFENMDESSMPIYLNIDWGDGSSQFYDNNILQSNLKVINNFNTSPVFLSEYTHDYYPSETSLYKSLTGQILIKYTNSEQTWFLFPVKIRTYDYYESIYDLTLANTNILPSENNAKQYQLKTDVGGFLVELRSS
jgi:hypothetical protein